MTDKLKDEIINYLRGTCNSINEICEMFNVDEDEISDAGIYDEIDCCACCGWWHDIDELDEVGCELLCEDCRENNDY